MLLLLGPQYLAMMQLSSIEAVLHHCKEHSHSSGMYRVCVVTKHS